MARRIADNHPVLELLRERQRSGSKPGQRQDPYSLALSIEGGGMRGVVSGGMVTALHHLGLRDCFDAVYGSSAGAINGAFFLSGQTPYGVTIYYENINNSSFINLARAFQGKAAMSLEFLLDEVMAHDKVLDWKAVISTSIDFNVVCTSVSDASVKCFNKFPSREALIEALRASARIPVVAGPPVSIDGKLYTDATVLESVPYESVLSGGHTHVLVLRTRHHGLRLGKPSAFTQLIAAPQMARLNPKLREAFATRPNRYNHVAEQLERLNEAPEVTGPHMLTVFPPDDVAEVGRMETSREKLAAGAAGGVEATYEALTGTRPHAVEVLVPYDNRGLLAQDSIKTGGLDGDWICTSSRAG